MRPITKTYADPLDLVWLHAAKQMGMRVERSAEVNASWSGNGVLTIGTAETLDPDDSLAQMILHEACHALVEGPESLAKLDWGLLNNPDKKAHEHACLRLQAAFADLAGMRAFFASTTMFRPYYDALPDVPLADGDDPAIAMAQTAWRRAFEGAWGKVIADALGQTAHIAQAVRRVAPENSLWQYDPR
ncbi:hypothetical protein [Botrimarina mediterranea]|uniref:Uncharacterized protein n=1 Tax=Botrimarina mediterranea TaxID=2528022 RepID=A0A518K2T0_9BACT|nr:hypothetical protein [Botrimarina mediterranea]QDV72116.1 hypothetical protein Spa11_02870 [Botrimarina mediterranea]QDV76658.1 hypothetical protein K2D_02380 [Planctomycetes bacterium K2D]